MKVFRDLEIQGPLEALQRLLTRIEERATGDWWRDHERDKTSGLPGSPMFCFRCRKAGDREAASVWMVLKHRQFLYVSNVVPDELRELTHDQYNHILEQFHRDLLDPATKDLPVKVTLTSDDATLERWLSPKAIEHLKRFSQNANRSTGAGHPHDRDRWHQFVFTSYDEGMEIPHDMLSRWLHEEEGWGDERAHDLASDYESIFETLKAYKAFQG